MSDAEKVTDHDRIRAWVNERDGQPAAVTDTLDDGKKGAILRIRFQDDENDLTPLFWDQFFEIFDDNGLAALLQDETADGSTSRFVKFVNR